MRWRDRWPWVDDPRSTIRFEPHYTYHPAWAARVLAETRPARHVDIGSTLPFITMVSAFLPVDYYEWRPPELRLSGLSCSHANLLALPFASNSIQSLSCMHTAEHVGMGRYGDPMEANGDLKAMAELQRVLAPGGNLLFVVPIGGKAKIRYNADRIYTYQCVVRAFSALKLVQFALILEDASGMVYDEEARQRAATQVCGCGCFWFRKPEAATASSTERYSG